MNWKIFASVDDDVSHRTIYIYIVLSYLITNFVLTITTITAGVVRGKKKLMEEEAKQKTYYEGSKIYKKNIE